MSGHGWLSVCVPGAKCSYLISILRSKIVRCSCLEIWRLSRPSIAPLTWNDGGRWCWSLSMWAVNPHEPFIHSMPVMLEPQNTKGSSIAKPKLYFVSELFQRDPCRYRFPSLQSQTIPNHHLTSHELPLPRNHRHHNCILLPTSPKKPPRDFPLHGHACLGEMLLLLNPFWWCNALATT